MIATFETLKQEYKSHINEFKKEVGTLEAIRLKLALSRRQICKLLMVDPSAWTRWTKKNNDAPAHIYQALKWYMQLIEKNPDVHEPLKIEKRIDLLQKDFLSHLHGLDNKISQVNDLAKEQSQQQLRAQDLKEDPKRALELEIIKYDNKKLSEKLLTLETKLTQIALSYDQLLIKNDRLILKLEEQSKRVVISGIRKSQIIAQSKKKKLKLMPKKFRAKKMKIKNKNWQSLKKINAKKNRKSTKAKNMKNTKANLKAESLKRKYKTKSRKLRS